MKRVWPQVWGEAFTVTSVKEIKMLVKASTITHLVLEWLNVTFWVCAGDLALDWIWCLFSIGCFWFIEQIVPLIWTMTCWLLAHRSGHKASSENKVSVMNAMRALITIVLYVGIQRTPFQHISCVLYARRLLTFAELWFSGPCISMFRYIFQVSDSPLQSLWFGHRWPLAVHGSGGLSTRCPGFLELWDNDAFLLSDAECVAER